MRIEWAEALGALMVQRNMRTVRLERADLKACEGLELHVEEEGDVTTIRLCEVVQIEGEVVKR